MLLLGLDLRVKRIFLCVPICTVYCSLTILRKKGNALRTKASRRKGFIANSIFDCYFLLPFFRGHLDQARTEKPFFFLECTKRTSWTLSESYLSIYPTTRRTEKWPHNIFLLSLMPCLTGLAMDMIPRRWQFGLRLQKKCFFLFPIFVFIVLYIFFHTFLARKSRVFRLKTLFRSEFASFSHNLRASRNFFLSP